MRKICGNSKVICQLKQNGKKQGDNERTAVKGETKFTKRITFECLTKGAGKIRYIVLYPTSDYC